MRRPLLLLGLAGSLALLLWRRNARERVAGTAVAVSAIAASSIAQVVTMGTPRGIRNNNPGNLRPGSNWQGLATPPSDGGYLRFTDPKWGIRALAKDLLKDFNVDGQRTVRALINEFAPPADKNDTTAYVSTVCKKLGVGPDQELRLGDDATLLRLIEAIIHHENGQQPYSYATIMAAISLAR